MNLYREFQRIEQGQILKLKPGETVEMITGPTVPLTERDFGELTGTILAIQNNIPKPSIDILTRALERLAYLEQERKESK